MKKLMVIVTMFLVHHTVSGQTQAKRNLLPFSEFEQKLEVEGENAQVLDARSVEEYEQNHVKGAVNVADDEQFEAVVSSLLKESPVFIYSIGNGRSAQLANKLREQGFTEVYEFPGGLSKWIGLGKPVVSTVGEGLSLADFNKQVVSDKLVLVEVGSRYCGGCKKLKPIVEEVAKEKQDKVKLIDIEAYDNKQLTKDLAVEGLPTLILYKGTAVIWKKQGISSKEEILSQINKHKI